MGPPPARGAFIVAPDKENPVASTSRAPAPTAGSSQQAALAAKTPFRQTTQQHQTDRKAGLTVPGLGQTTGKKQGVLGAKDANVGKSARKDDPREGTHKKPQSTPSLQPRQHLPPSALTFKTPSPTQRRYVPMAFSPPDLEVEEDNSVDQEPPVWDDEERAIQCANGPSATAWDEPVDIGDDAEYLLAPDVQAFLRKLPAMTPMRIDPEAEARVDKERREIKFDMVLSPTSTSPEEGAALVPLPKLPSTSSSSSRFLSARSQSSASTSRGGAGAGSRLGFSRTESVGSAVMSSGRVGMAGGRTSSIQPQRAFGRSATTNSNMFARSATVTTAALGASTFGARPSARPQHPQQHQKGSMPPPPLPTPSLASSSERRLARGSSKASLSSLRSFTNPSGPGASSTTAAEQKEQRRKQRTEAEKELGIFGAWSDSEEGGDGGLDTLLGGQQSFSQLEDSDSVLLL